MAVSIDRWSPGDRTRLARRLAPTQRAPSRRGARKATAAHSLQVPLPQPEPAANPQWHGYPIAIRVLGCWLAVGVILLLTCPPLWSAQTWVGALPLWLVGLPAASLAALALARTSAPLKAPLGFL